MRMLESGKAAIARNLREQAEGPVLMISLAAIHGLGELGGPEAISQIEELIETHSNVNAKLDALLRAYGRAGRHLEA